MNPRIGILMVTAGLLMLAIWRWLPFKHLSRVPPVSPQAQGSAASGPIPTVSGGGTATFGHSAAQNLSPAALAAVPTPAPAEQPADPEMLRWLREEAKDIDKIGLNTQSKKTAMAKVVEKLTPSQNRQLLQSARSLGASAGEKILATYLLAEAGAPSRPELIALITTPLSDPGPHEPHTEGETRGMQEKALRMMGLEALIASAQKDPAAREALVQTIPNIPDPYIQRYAQRRLDELNTH